MVWQNAIWHENMYKAEMYHWIIHTETLYLLTLIKNLLTFTVDTSPVKQWVMHLRNIDSDIYDKPSFGCPCIASCKTNEMKSSWSSLLKIHSQWWWLSVKIVFYSQKLALSCSAMIPRSVLTYMKINRMHYFKTVAYCKSKCSNIKIPVWHNTLLMIPELNISDYE